MKVRMLFFVLGGLSFMITFDSLLENIKNPNFDTTNLKQLYKAYEIAEFLHRGVVRESGEPYITHPLTVANIMLDNWYVDVDTLSAALLHDVLEDTQFTFQDIAKELNFNVAVLVDGVSKLKGMKLSDKQSIKYANERKLVEGIFTDPRIYLLKLSDRLHNMRTIGFKKKREKQIENALETLDLFFYMANFMGTSAILNELANLSFQCIDPLKYQKIDELRQKLEANSKNEILVMLQEIQNILKDYSIPNEIKFRIKNNYQLYQRLRKGNCLQDINDLFAFKIIVEDAKACYEVFDILKSRFSIIDQFTRDFIISPKENMYQSLHLATMGSNKIFQMQIKSQRMHEVSEYGYGAFWKFYGEDAMKKMKEEISKKRFFQNIQKIEELEDNKQFVEQVRFEVFNNDFVHVYTPKNDMFTFPKGSTPLDFAYSIHTDLLKNFMKAMVNGKFVPINYVLQNNDRVEIFCHENSFLVKEDWEQHAKTIGAKRFLRRINK